MDTSDAGPVQTTLDLSILGDLCGPHDSMILLSQNTPSLRGWEHEGAIFNKVSLSLLVSSL